MLVTSRTKPQSPQAGELQDNSPKDIENTETHPLDSLSGTSDEKSAEKKDPDYNVAAETSAKPVKNNPKKKNNKTNNKLGLAQVMAL